MDRPSGRRCSLDSDGLAPLSSLSSPARESAENGTTLQRLVPESRKRSSAEPDGSWTDQTYRREPSTHPSDTGPSMTVLGRFQMQLMQLEQLEQKRRQAARLDLPLSTTRRAPSPRLELHGVPCDSYQEGVLECSKSTQGRDAMLSRTPSHHSLSSSTAGADGRSSSSWKTYLCSRCGDSFQDCANLALRTDPLSLARIKSPMCLECCDKATTLHAKRQDPRKHRTTYDARPPTTQKDRSERTLQKPFCHNSRAQPTRIYDLPGPAHVESSPNFSSGQPRSSSPVQSIFAREELPMTPWAPWSPWSFHVEQHDPATPIGPDNIPYARAGDVRPDHAVRETRPPRARKRKFQGSPDEYDSRSTYSSDSVVNGSTSRVLGELENVRNDANLWLAERNFFAQALSDAQPGGPTGVHHPENHEARHISPAQRARGWLEAIEMLLRTSDEASDDQAVRTSNALQCLTQGLDRLEQKKGIQSVET